MNIESNRNALNIPSWYSRANMADQSGESPSFQPTPSIPPDHLEPRPIDDCADARNRRKLEQNNVLIETAARWMKCAQEWKAKAERAENLAAESKLGWEMWMREVMRRPEFPKLQAERHIDYGL